MPANRPLQTDGHCSAFGRPCPPLNAGVRCTTGSGNQMRSFEDYCYCGTSPEPDAPLDSTCAICGKPYYIMWDPAFPEGLIDQRPAQLHLEDPGSNYLRVASIVQSFLQTTPARALELVRSTPCSICDVEPERVVDVEEGVLVREEVDKLLELQASQQDGERQPLGKLAVELGFGRRRFLPV